MLLHDSRRMRAPDDAGDLVLLEDQDRATWDHAGIDEALLLVPERAPRAAAGRGPYALQAAIAALHARSATRPPTPIGRRSPRCSRSCCAGSPSPVIALNHAVAIAMWEGPGRGLPWIDGLEQRASSPAITCWHAARADLLRRLGRPEEAADRVSCALSPTSAPSPSGGI